jgi:hypothetical protein
MERAVWKELGQNWESFTRRPALEVEQYLTIISLIYREENARMRAPATSGRGA